jgi:hypothetical protein
MATEVVILSSLGHVDGPRNLDGRTGDGSVALAPHTGSPFSGTRWRRRTQEGTVGLAPNTRPPFTGTRWRAARVGDGFTLECLGDLEGPRFLDGRTHDGTVALAPNTQPPFTGTLWKVGVPFGNDVELIPISE